MNLPICSHCEILVMDKNLLKALNTIWHYRCFKCDCCDAVLADLSNSFYFKFGKKLCFQDYMRLFGPTKDCSACRGMILASEYVISVAKDAVFHLHCFQCFACHKSFYVGEQFVYNKVEGRVFCTLSDCLNSIERDNAQ